MVLEQDASVALCMVVRLHGGPTARWYGCTVARRIDRAWWQPRILCQMSDVRQSS